MNRVTRATIAIVAAGVAAGVLTTGIAGTADAAPARISPVVHVEVTDPTTHQYADVVVSAARAQDTDVVVSATPDGGMTVHLYERTGHDDAITVINQLDPTPVEVRVWTTPARPVFRGSVPGDGGSLRVELGQWS